MSNRISISATLAVSRRFPDRARTDGGGLTAVIQTYGEKWHAKDVALVGYSFGADVLPSVYNDLATGVKSHVAQISLLEFANAADWATQVKGWLGAAPSSEAVPIATAIEQVPSKLVQCFYGMRRQTHSATGSPREVSR
ncbi:hypothetical protein CK227_24050 [Mesorhizobium sp. WSM4308]|nr:hypothetical protein CK232_25310 [Mesorhizobium sp. WSM4304]PBB72936.1 hypothetical protein CK227_24050 [Mesorhizobium sp. WSM4308]